MSEAPTSDRINALLTLVADEDDRAVLQRLQEALSINTEPDDADVEVYQDLWDTFGEETEEGEPV